MIRSILIMLFIWGLIAQPLLAAMPTPMKDNSPRSLITTDSSAAVHSIAHHGNQNVEKSSKAPCHENTTDDSSSEASDNCDMGCKNGHCVCCYVTSGASAIQKWSISLDLSGSTLVLAYSGARAYGLPSRIFHPPKHT